MNSKRQRHDRHIGAERSGQAWQGQSFRCRLGTWGVCRRHAPHRVFAMVLALCVAWVVAPLAAQVTVVEDESGLMRTYRMTVSPAPEPEPALKYRLLKHEEDRGDGNAAPYYYRALLHLDQRINAVQEKYGDEFHTWYSVELPLSELPKDKVREAMRGFSGYVMEELREATSRRYCDWGWEVHRIRGPELFAFLLQEIQESRGLARLLAIQTRLAIAEGRMDDAIELTQMNLQLGQDVAIEPFLVGGLVGIAISGVANTHTLEFMAAPGSPSLYWALAELPKPLIGLRAAARFELGFGPRVFPLLEAPETEQRTPEEWSRSVGETWSTVTNLAERLSGIAGELPASFRGPEWESAEFRLIATGFSFLGYTQAKRELIHSGMSVEEVEAMPVGQVIAIQAARAYRHTAQEMEKLWYMPFSEMPLREDAIVSTLQREGYMDTPMSSKEIIPIASLLLPATFSARQAEVRLTRDIAAMQVIEALRMHAAKTGAFPAELGKVTVVPVPRNPATEKAFEYRLDGEMAILELPESDGFPGLYRRYEITLRAAENGTDEKR